MNASGTTQPNYSSTQSSTSAAPTYSSNANTNTSANLNNSQSATMSGTQSTNQSINQQTGQSTFAGSASTSVQNDAQVTTVIQQYDTQGPAVVVDRVTSQYSDLTCSPENARSLVQALHDGTPVTLNVNGQSTTFNPQGQRLGYGEAYIALALAAEELRGAGITSCATPDQWNAVLLGGPISTTTTASTSGGTTQFPGVLTLHSQGQGWGQIAQTTHVQLGQIVSSASSSSTVSPTGYSSAQMNQGRPANDDANAATNADENGKQKGKHKHHWWSSHDDSDTNSSTDAAHNSSSTHADASSTNTNSNSAQPSR
jgi:hypothetical protein